MKPPLTYGQIQREVLRWSRGLPPRSMSIPYTRSAAVGILGDVVPHKGLRQTGRQERDTKALIRDELRWFGQRGAITTWDGLLAARAAGKADDPLVYKAVSGGSGVWYSTILGVGLPPAAAAFTNAPGGAVLNSASVGAIPLVLPAGDDAKYIASLYFTTATSVSGFFLLSDLLVAAGNIPSNSTAATTVNTAALTRYTDGVGVCPILYITTATGANATNITVTYTGDVNGAAQTTGAIALHASYRAAHSFAPTGCWTDYSTPGTSLEFRLPLASGDSGALSVDTVQFSAATASAGRLAALLHKPLMLVQKISIATRVESLDLSTPQALLSLVELPVGTDDKLGFIFCINCDGAVFNGQLMTVAG